MRACRTGKTVRERQYGYDSTVFTGLSGLQKAKSKKQKALPSIIGIILYSGKIEI